VRIAILGVGKIGEALLAGVLSGPGTSPDDVVICERVTARASEIAERYGVRSVDDPAEAVADADVVVLAVKPGDLLAVTTATGTGLAQHAMVVSVAAGISAASIESVLPPHTPVVRVMPNTPMLVGQGMSALAPGGAAGPEHLDRAEALMASVGRVVRVPEAQIDVVTAVSGSGPAYLFLVVEAMIDAGVLLGLPRPLATELATQTALGAATMLRETGEHPALLREAVTSPGGTTAAALRELENGGLRAALYDALEACRDRAQDLARS
jgi:pyrroline-5-carboxylate reductase